MIEPDFMLHQRLEKSIQRLDKDIEQHVSLDKLNSWEASWLQFYGSRWDNLEINISGRSPAPNLEAVKRAVDGRTGDHG